MAIVKFNDRTLRPFYPSFFDEFFFDDFLTMPKKANGSTPATNIEETDTEFKLDMAIPGMNKDDITVEIKNGVLSVSAEKEESSEEKDKNYTRKEYSYNSFERSFTLPGNVTKTVSAKYEDGVLHISLPKQKVEVSKTKRIEVA